MVGSFFHHRVSSSRGPWQPLKPMPPRSTGPRFSDLIASMITVSVVTADHLVAYWSQFRDGVHPEDRCYVDDADFATDLLPVPWAGSVKAAKVYLLFLNPGLAPSDRAYERDNEQFRETLRSNLNGDGRYPYLLGRFEGHSGHRWAARVFSRDVTERDADRICMLQLVPYHSEKGGAARRVARRLPSSAMARRFLHDTLLPAAGRREIGVVVARSARPWQLAPEKAHDRLVVYGGYECRSAFLTPGSRGGSMLRNVLRS